MHERKNMLNHGLAFTEAQIDDFFSNENRSLLVFEVTLLAIS